MSTVGIEARSRIRWNNAHTLSFNLGGAYDQEHTRATLTSDWTKDFLRNFAIYAGFQDECILVDDQLTASRGLDFRNEDKSQISTISPNARLIWQLQETDRVWASFSQAKRTTPVSLSVIQSLRSARVSICRSPLKRPLASFPWIAI